MNKLFPVILLCLMSSFAFAQNVSLEDVAKKYIKSQAADWNLTNRDIEELALYDQLLTQSNGMQTLYFNQSFNGIGIKNSIVNISFDSNGNILYVGNRLQANIKDRIKAYKPTISAAEALLLVSEHLGMKLPAIPRIIPQEKANRVLFDKSDIARQDIILQLNYWTSNDLSIHLCWQLDIEALHFNDYWSFQIDALSGEILDKSSYSTHCSFHKDHFGKTESCLQKATIDKVREKEEVMGPLADAQYTVFPFPYENPLQTNRILVSDPADLLASPFGWHDTNGVAGAESTKTMGNNVHAFQAKAGNFGSLNDEPNGGSNLVFTSSLDLNLEPENYTAAATTQLFYGINYMHDWAYRFGFDETANFQTKNYKNIGIGNDRITALAQFDANTLNNINNATFTSPSDGQAGTVQMFLWNNDLSDDALLKVNAPFIVSGTYATGKATFGKVITFNDPTTGDVAFVEDIDPDFPTFGCLDLMNVDEVKGKIAMVDRGICDFDLKAFNAQKAGAIACIICNTTDVASAMDAVLYGDSINIPVVRIKKSDCTKIRQYAGTGGLNITLQAPQSANSGPNLLDGDLDNGIIAHEFGHGITTRLTGGPGNSSCLQNREQMGEGWSDFFGLVTTVKSYDNKNESRGFGTYVSRQDSSERGIRTYPYSTSMAVNPHTYGNIINNSQVHYVGEVWNAMLWDLFWAMTDKYGFDASLKDPNSGGYKAVKMIIDALKIQPCSPGFEDGRDAIIAADKANNNGDNECLIWEVFARRGLGFLADQGSSLITIDATEDFTTKPACLNRIDITKEMTPLVKAGNNIDVKLTVSNFKTSLAQNISVTDIIPSGTSFIVGSASLPVTVNGDVLTFSLGNLTVGQKIVIAYKINTPANISSETLLFEDVEGGLAPNWNVESLIGGVSWTAVNGVAFGGTKSLGILDVPSENRHNLVYNKKWKVTGTRPALRFYHNYNTEKGGDGGFLEISENDGKSWQNVNGKFLRGDYPGRIQYATFVLPNTDGFSGNSNGWKDCYLDLSEYVGKDIKMRFRYGSDNFTGGLGWYIDNYEYLDLKSYNSEACATASTGEQYCASAMEEGSVIDSKPLSIQNQVIGDLLLFPNPANSTLHVKYPISSSGNVSFEIYSMDGLLQIAKRAIRNDTTESIDISQLPGGSYVLRMVSKNQVFVSKFLVVK